MSHGWDHYVGAEGATLSMNRYGASAPSKVLLKEFGFTATVYVTTYYVQRNHPIYRLALQYMFWKTAFTTAIFTGLLVHLNGMGSPKGDACDPHDP